jgi:hypothetical protein
MRELKLSGDSVKCKGKSKKNGQSKDEGIRKGYLRDLRTIFQFRHGPQFPNNEQGKNDLELLLFPVSLHPTHAAENMKKIIETSADWMPKAEMTSLIDNLIQLPLWSRKLSPQEWKERVKLTNAQREYLKAWRIRPIDLTDDELAEWNKAKKRKRDTQRRRAAGAVPRSIYLAQSVSKSKPWIAEGMSRAKWYRLRETSPRQVLTSGGLNERLLAFADSKAVSQDSTQTPLHEGPRRDSTRYASETSVRQPINSISSADLSHGVGTERKRA